MERSKSTVAPVRLDRKNMTVLDHQLSRILKRERDAAAAKSARSDDAEKAQNMPDDEEMEHHWRRRLLRLLHHHQVHTAMTSLLILDLITVVVGDSLSEN
jgi:hypothetical protein